MLLDDSQGCPGGTVDDPPRTMRFCYGCGRYGVQSEILLRPAVVFVGDQPQCTNRRGLGIVVEKAHAATVGAAPPAQQAPQVGGVR